MMIIDENMFFFTRNYEEKNVIMKLKYKSK